MNPKFISVLTIAAAAGSALTCLADLERLDSSQFDYKYEMMEKPTNEDLDSSGGKDFTGENATTPWCTLGTGADVGTMLMDMSAGNKSLTSSASVGSDGDLWKKMGATHQTGYTIETRLKVLESTGSAGSFFLNASLPGGQRNCFLYFFSDQLKWGGSKVVDITTTAWHTYRVVRLANSEKYHLYIDGLLVNDNLQNAYSGELNRLIFGAGGGNYKSKIRVSYLRLTKGAYAPVDEKDNRRDSVEFAAKYEMDAADTRISTSANASAWTISGQTGATISENNGILSVTPNGEQTYWRTTDAAWKNLVTADTAFTVEFSAKINSCTISGGDRTLQFWVATPRATGNIIIGTNHVYWQVSTAMGDNILLDSSDNTDAMHKFRIAYDGKTRHGFTVWRDEVKIGENLVDLTAYNGASHSFVRFGIPGSTSGGSFDVDYIRWALDGVYSPYTRKGLLIIVK